jgi:MoxR-like ATPase
MADPVVSCENCPFYIAPGSQVSILRKNIKAGVCAKYGKVLYSPNQDSRTVARVLRATAESCPSFGQPNNMLQDEIQGVFNQRGSLLVALPDMDRRVPAPGGAPVSSCAMCQHFVRDDTVFAEWGWTGGFCKARGRLILPNQQVSQATGCEYAIFGGGNRSIGDVSLFAEFSVNFGKYDPIAAFMASRGTFVDPTQYPTDKPVTDEDRAHGIRAWRIITDATSSERTVTLPIYDIASMPEEVQVKVPRTGDDEHPEDYIDHNNAVYRIAVLWTELDETPALWGMAGTGKTELFRHMAWMMCLPFERISITASTELDDLFGKMHFSKEKGTFFEYGRLPRAWSSPCVICLDEPNTGQPEVWQAIRPLTDNSKQLVLDLNKGERIARHDDCYLGMAMNPAWDTKNIGAAPISDADGSRLMHIFMTLPPEQLEREILKKRCLIDGWEIDEDQLKMIMGIAKEIRPLTDDQTLPITWGIRPQIKAARALRWFDPITAYRMASADFLEPEAQETLLDIVRAHTEGN